MLLNVAATQSRLLVAFIGTCDFGCPTNGAPHSRTPFPCYRSRMARSKDFLVAAPSLIIEFIGFYQLPLLLEEAGKTIHARKRVGMLFAQHLTLLSMARRFICSAS